MKSNAFPAALAAFVLASLAGALMLESCASSGSVTATAKPASAAPAGSSDPLPLKVPATDSAIVYTGRVDFANPGTPSFAFPGVCVEANFTGTGIDVLLADMGKNYFNVSIDGGAPRVVKTVRGMKSYVIARGLAAGTHSIRVFKRTESSCGIARFGGFLLEEGQALAKAPVAPSRKLEFIGDSITCGYGNMVSTNDPAKFPYKPENENNELAWGCLTAKALGASYVATSYSGRGMFRNNVGSESGTLPKIYGEIYADNPGKAAWDFSRYVPDMIFINLGTNDMSSQLCMNDLKPAALHDAFAKTYKEFIAKLRSVYGPATKIVCAVGPMIGDSYPPGCDSWTRIQASVSGLVGDLNKAGDANVFYLMLEPQSAPFGEDWHPTAATHARMADEAVAKAREIMGW